MFIYPWDFSIDSDHNLYVSDYTNSRIIKFSSRSLVGVPLTSGAGSGLSQVYYPSGSFIDTYGNLYIIDTFNYRVMKYTNISSISLSPPIIGHVAVDSLGYIYISDYTYNRVMKWAPGGTTGTLAAGIGNGTAGNGMNQLSCPYGIYVDRSMALYIADTCNGRIQKWLPGASAGITVAGGNGQLVNPTDVIVDSYGTIYVLNYWGVYRFYPGSTTGTLVVSSNTPSYGFKFDSVGNVYIADYSNNVIKKYTVNSTVCGAYMSCYELYSVKVNIYLIFLF
jgi:sugar lactone lactonase YvrE